MSQPENTQQHEDDDDPSSQLESLAIQEQQPSDAPTTGEERALEAERLAEEAMKNSSGDIDTAKAKSELLQAAAQLRLIKKLKSKAKK